MSSRLKRLELPEEKGVRRLMLVAPPTSSRLKRRAKPAERAGKPEALAAWPGLLPKHLPRKLERRRRYRRRPLDPKEARCPAQAPWFMRTWDLNK